MRGGRRIARAGRAGGADFSAVFTVPIYGFRLLVLYFSHGEDATREAVAREAGRRLGRHGFDFSKGFPVADGGARMVFGDGCMAAVFTAGGKRAVSAGHIAHECFHAVMAASEDYGFVLDQTHDEPAAYLLEWLVEGVSSRLAAAGIRILPSAP